MKDWKFVELLRLLATFNGFSSNTLVPDQFRWGAEHVGRYYVKAAYKLIWKVKTHNAITHHSPWKLIWKIKLTMQSLIIGLGS